MEITFTAKSLEAILKSRLPLGQPKEKYNCDNSARQGCFKKFL
jgi:hypothetical protein